MSLIIISALSSSRIGAEPKFAISDLSDDDRLLFTSTVGQPGWGDYDSLFLTDIAADDEDIRSLTYFPEQSRYFVRSGVLEIQNRYGLHRTNLTDSSSMRTLDIMPSFLRGDIIPVGRVLPVSTSPDGRWVITQEPEGTVRGRLVLHDTAHGFHTVISENHVLNYRETPALWSPDSRYVLYSRDGKLYQVTLRHLEESGLPDESYREFGIGTLSSVRWAGADSLYYIVGTQVRFVRPSEFFTRSFYTDPLPVGQTAGSIPVEFDPHFDSFWPAPDGESLLVLKENRHLFLFPLDGDQAGVSLPFLLLPRDNTVLQIWWRNDGDILLLAGRSRRDGASTRLYRLDSRANTPGDQAFFLPVDIDGIRRFVPSPHRSLLAVLRDSEILLLDPDSFDERYRLPYTDPRNLFWIDERSMVILGAKRTEVFSLEDDSTRLIALSSVDTAGFDREGHIGAVSEGRTYRWDETAKQWIAATAGAGGGFQTPGVTSSRHRVYLEDLSSSRYDNRIIVRTTDGFGNRPLFTAPSVPVPNPVAADDPTNMDSEMGYFGHGARNGGRDVALVFNAVDGDEGLGEVLSILADYDLTATFFVGGDFIRRQPESTRLLAESRHEIGSLFYTQMDMTDFRYRIDTDFVVRGMGRNEDEFFRATGREVSTIWHAPWYVISPSILDATRRMNYVYVGRDVDPLDWVVLDGSGVTGALYRPSPDLVENLLNEVRPGSVIPIRIGKPGKREDYFFREIDLLINGLLNDGYHIVTVGELMESN